MVDVTRELDITSEEFRVYTYGDGSTFRIDNPETLYVLVDDKGQTTHRVVDVDGVTHRPERGFVGISWSAKDGAPKFVA
jgi:hypothetical protein